MDEATFHRRATAALKALEQALADLDEGLEADLAADILTLEFADGRQFVINSHSAARQIWMAANLNAWHFSFDEASGRWVDSKGGGDLWSVVLQAVSRKLGRPVQLPEPAGMREPRG